METVIWGSDITEQELGWRQETVTVLCVTDMCHCAGHCHGWLRLCPAGKCLRNCGLHLSCLKYRHWVVSPLALAPVPSDPGRPVGHYFPHFQVCPYVRWPVSEEVPWGGRWDLAATVKFSLHSSLNCPIYLSCHFQPRAAHQFEGQLLIKAVGCLKKAQIICRVN